LTFLPVSPRVRRGDLKPRSGTGSQYFPQLRVWGQKRLPPKMYDEPAGGLCRPIFDRGDFRGLGDQACAAERSYSACAALCLSRHAGCPGILREGTTSRRGPYLSSPARHFLSSACGRDQALADLSRRADPSGPQF
jgi:hypothetical protein